jgi:hypothetical protein
MLQEPHAAVMAERMAACIARVLSASAVEVGS